ncbi:MAG: hypothetical protein K1X53_14155 [Candidatus Sumerlaeaceae bacterium]|nr:hypothetical protein [Candidatus Sumerlaeaceae bacterium]
MKIPKFWSQASAKTRGRNGDEVFAIKWHWSDSSESDAQSKAQRAADSLAARIASGEPWPDHYAYATETPLREEILREIGGSGSDAQAVITRNAYGAQVLNAARVMFVDIDLPEKKAKSSGGGLLSRLFGKAPAEPAGPPPAETAALARVEDWARGNSGASFRAYRTAAGLRLIATHDLFDPESSATIGALEALGSDPLYVKLCRVQKCFRARLTPKPWRLGLHAPFVRYPYPQPAEMAKWVQKYDQASSGHATCTFIKDIGTRTSMPGEVQTVLRIHDDACRATAGGLALA